jgi:hypothetical protein
VSAIVLDESGDSLPGLNVRWKSTDAEVARVDSLGVITALLPGVAQVAATYVRTDGSVIEDRATITVRKATRIVSDPPPPSWGFGTAGQPYHGPVRFRVTDVQDAGVQGVTVDFTVEGGGKLSLLTAVTDSLGYVAVDLILGPIAGWNVVEAHVRGTDKTAKFAVQTVPVPTLSFSRDTLTLMQHCSEDLVGHVYTADSQERTGLYLSFEATDSSVVELHQLMIPGTYRGHLRSVYAKAPGTSLVIASYEGAVDTARVTVTPARPVALSAEDTVRVLTGGLIQVFAHVMEECAGIENAPISYTSLDPATASVDQQGQVRGLSDGVARIELGSGVLRDTVVVLVRTFEIVPGDTTVAVGDTVRYQVLTRDPGGKTVPFVGAAFYAASQDGAMPDAVVRMSTSGTAVAIGPGDAIVYAYTDPPIGGWVVHGQSDRRTIHVVAR